MMTRFLSISKDITGQTVYDAVEEKVGVIQDVFFSPETSQALFVVLSEGGFMGLGSDTYALPWKMLEFNTNSGSILLEVRRDKLIDAPEIDLDKLRGHDRDEINRLAEYYGYHDLIATKDVEQEDYQAERTTDHPHQGYEGSAKITGEAPDSQPADDMDYEKLKGLKQDQ